MTSSCAASLGAAHALNIARGVSASHSEQLRHGVAKTPVLQPRHGFCKSFYGALTTKISFPTGSISQQRVVRTKLEKPQISKQPGRRRRQLQSKVVAKAEASSPPYNVVITGSSKGDPLIPFARSEVVHRSLHLQSYNEVLMRFNMGRDDSQVSMVLSWMV